MSRLRRQERKRLSKKKAIKALRHQLANRPQHITTGWFDLPYEMRSIIIDEMDTKCKARFAMCSKVCYDEVGISKKYYKRLTFDEESYIKDNLLTVGLYEGITFEMNYLENDYEEFKYIYKCPTFKVEHDILESEIEPASLSHFQRILANSFYLKTFKIKASEWFPFHSVNIQHLKSLDSIRIYQSMWGSKFKDLIECKFIVPEKLCKIKKLIHIQGVSLTCDQLIDLKAKKIRLRPMKLSSKEVNHYLKLVMCGELHENVEKVKLTMDKNFKLDAKEIIDGLNITNKYNENDVTWFDLKISTRPQMFAKIRITHSTFLLVTSTQRAMRFWKGREDDEDILHCDSLDEDTDVCEEDLTIFEDLY